MTSPLSALHMKASGSCKIQVLIDFSITIRPYDLSLGYPAHRTLAEFVWFFSNTCAKRISFLKQAESQLHFSILKYAQLAGLKWILENHKERKKIFKTGKLNKAEHRKNENHKKNDRKNVHHA